MKASNWKALVIANLVFISLNAQAELPANQAQALKEQIFSRLNAPAPSTVETLAMMTNTLKDIEQRISTVSTSMIAEMTRASREYAVFDQKARVQFDPLKDPAFKKRVTDLSVKFCCEEYAAKLRKSGG